MSMITEDPSFFLEVLLQGPEKIWSIYIVAGEKYVGREPSIKQKDDDHC